MPPIPTLLIADDDADVRDMLKKLFATEPCRLVFAENGEEALALAVEAFPDVILLDVMMPGLDSLEVCRRLRADPRLGGVPIVLITALADQTTCLAGIEAGADDFIPKPFERVELLARVHAILRFNRYRQLYEEHVRFEAERQQAEAALRESEARFRHAVASVPEHIYVSEIRGEGQIVNIYQSPQVERLTGYPHQRFMDDWTFWLETVIHPADRETAQAQVARLLAGQASVAEYRLLRSDGNGIWVRDSARLETNSAGVKTIYGVVMDITDHKQAEIALRESEERWRLLVSASPDYIALHDPEGKYLFLNHYAEGFTEQEVIGSSLYQYLSPDSAAIFRKNMEAVLATRTSQRFEVTGLGNHGAWKTYEEYLVPLTARNQEVNILAVARDITHRKLAEEALRQSEENYRNLFKTVAQKSDELRALSLRLAESEEAERRQLARELHDQVGQNLTALGISLTLVQMQLVEKADSPLRARLADAATLVEQISETIRSVMAELRPPVLDDYGLEAALHWYADEFTRRFGLPVVLHSQEIKPRLTLPVETATFRIVQEALNNVGKHAQATSVTITLVDKPDNVSVSIVDNGVGFEPASVRQAGKLPSWGLLTMRERAEAIGGHLQVDSEPGKGTAITVEVKR